MARDTSKPALPEQRSEQSRDSSDRWDWVKRNPVLRTSALILAVAFAPGCNEEPAPISTAKSFAAAVQRNDIKAMLDLVDARAAEYLQSSAERASDQIGGRRSVDPQEMLQIVDVDPRFAVAKAELLNMSDTTAQVKLTGADGTEHLIDLVHEEEEWKVQIRLPAPPPAPEVRDS